MLRKQSTTHARRPYQSCTPSLNRLVPAGLAMASKKVVLVLGLHDNDAREKRKVLKAVSAFPGLDLISVDMKARKLTVVGMVDPIELVTKLRKLWHAEILSVGPAKEDKQEAAAADIDRREGAAAGGGGVVEEGDYRKHRREVTAEQVVMERPAEMRAPWPHAVVYPTPHPYPYHPHQYGGAGGHGARPEDPRDYYYVAGGLGAGGNNHHPNSYVRRGHGARENHHPNPYVAHGHHGGARRNHHPNSPYGAQDDPNGCTIC